MSEAARLQPRLIAIGAVEIVWNQTRDACPGTNWAGHVGEQPDSMPLAWHNPQTNETSLISANDWGTFATVGSSLDALRAHDCSHRVYTSVNSSVPWSYANHQWMQSVHVHPNGTGYALIHSEFHGGMVGNASLCSSTGPAGCQYWSAGLGVTSDGGSHWTLAAPPPAHRAFSVPTKYVKDANNIGFGAIGAMAQPVEKDGFLYGHIAQVSHGTCAWRTTDLADPRAFRGWNGTHWATTWIDPYADPATGGDHTCLPVETGIDGNSHASVRTFAGPSWRPEGWPSHVMLGWTEGKRNAVGYSFPAWKESGGAGATAAPFTQWTEGQYLSIDDWIPHELRGCGSLMYPSLLDADSPFGLAANHGGNYSGNHTSSGDDAALGLSYGLIGNKSLALYFVIGRKYIARLRVAFLPAGAPEPGPGPFPPAPRAFNPVNCSALAVSGAGRSDVNGVYTSTTTVTPGSNGTPAPPLYQKDATHQLYYFQARWKLGWKGHVAFYEAQTSTAGETAVPIVWPGCGPGSPTVTCV